MYETKKVIKLYNEYKKRKFVGHMCKRSFLGSLELQRCIGESPESTKDGN